jgi:hypothetical protein
MSKFLEWFGRNRSMIGYVIGGINIVGGINDLLLGNIGSGTMFLVIGTLIVLDAKTFRS